ncbi:phosphate ABC transporter permease subunit PstC [Demequina capsici]|uniref:Phosphate transport system permease protein n=1 Tax=Demequina capsici TaxID=3075620 RepID=A0AA96F9U8_9MICO|nr:MULTISPECIES: phosphate ABC transporter permease subunit PstC [unclassified Demequina]WNM26017.1 phosphate ABC transporter permease subunit PstC [Demequina sp. OYTSA14]WNM28891.1 phosphate ABC transporter permease subunit PstC [Demequina sp. PMTSA13]
MSTFAASLILILLAAVAAFLLTNAWPALSMGSAALAEKVSWIKPDQGQSLFQVTGYLIFGTVLISVIALLIATPLSIGIALFISHYAPRRLAAGLGYIIDLLAAVPSVVYGLWGSMVLLPVVQPFYQWLGSTLGWIPLFAPDPTTGDVSPTGRVALSAGIVLAIMIIPIITAVTREVFLQTPKLHEEAALAMGATRWEMIRMAVFPFGRSGIIGATMLGLGRALGETMAIYMILSSGLSFSWNILQSGKHNTIASYIAGQFPEANQTGVSALIAMGLALFVITLLVNMAARWVVSRRSEFSGAN